MNIIEKIIQCAAEPPTKNCLWLNNGALKYFGGTGWTPVGADTTSVSGLNIPTKLSELTNDTGYITSAALTDYALSADIPTLVSQLTNDSNYVTSSDLESKGYQTADQCKEVVADLIGSAPEALDTLQEIADALGNDPNFATTITTLIGQKLSITTYETDKATFALKSEIPTDYVSTSDITNYLLITDAESTYAKITDLSNYVETSTLSNYYTKSEVDDKLTEVESKLTDVDNKVTTVDNRVTEVDSKVSDVDTKVTEVSNKVTEVDSRVTEVDTKLTNAVDEFQSTLTNYVTTDTFSSTLSTTLADYAKLTDIPTDYLTASDLTDYITESDLQTTLSSTLESYAKTEDLPDVSDMLTKTEAAATYQEKGNYLTEIPSEYITETELENKGYQTEEQVQAAIAELVNSAPEALDTLQELAAAINNDSDFAATVATQIGQKVDTSTYEADKETFALKTDLPTTTSELTNDSGYITETEANAVYQPVGDYALKSELPVNVSELNNDAGYVTDSQIPKATSELINDSGYITSSDLNNYPQTSDTSVVYGIPRLIPAFKNMSDDTYIEFTYKATGKFMGSFNIQCTGLYINAAHITFRLSHPVADESEWTILMFQNKNRIGYQKSGTNYSHLPSYSTDNILIPNYLKHFGHTWRSFGNISASSDIVSEFRTEWPLKKYAGSNVYYLEGYIPMNYPVRRGRTYTVSGKSATVPYHQAPVIGFALCKVENDVLIKGPMTIIRVGGHGPGRPSYKVLN